MGRAPCCDKAKVKRGPWSPEEDATLRSHIQKHGTGGNWIALPNKIGLKRCGKSCRLRWLNYLRPNLRHGGYTHDEDNLISTLYLTIGSRWSIIASQLPGRTDNDIKNYWNTSLKKKLLGKQRRRITTPQNLQPDTFTNTMSQMEPIFTYNNLVQEQQQQQVSHHHFATQTDFPQTTFDGTMYESMPPPLFDFDFDFDGGLNAEVNSSSSSQIWGDNSVANYPSMPTNYNQEMFTLFDDPIPL